MIETDLTRLEPENPIDLLDRDVFSIESEGERAEVSLAGLFSMVGRGTEVELTKLMPHQRHAMHAFTVQVMAMVAARSGSSSLERSEEEWRSALRELAGDASGPSVEAWQLVVSDLRKPAFLQPPVPESKLDRFEPAETPDALDMLVLAKNHDVKQSRIRHPRIEHWVFALLSLQTMDGYAGGGGGWQGISRMNKGYGNRPDFGMAPNLSWTQRLRRDVRVALAQRPNLVAPGALYADGGLPCVWTAPWDGTESLPLGALDPFFVEICRRVRFSWQEGRLRVEMRTTKAPRLAAKDYLGNVGDLWVPIDRARSAALTLGGGGLSYVKVADVLFSENWSLPAALEIRSEDGEAPLVTARALVRGKGKTEGLHERVIRVPKKARRVLGRREGRDVLGTMSRDRVQRAGALRLKILKPAMLAFLQGGAHDLRLDDDRANSLLDAVEAQVDAEFFPRLFDAVDRDAEQANVEFERWLIDLGRAALERAFDTLPTSIARRERAIAEAERRFFGGARKNFPKAFEGQREATS